MYAALLRSEAKPGQWIAISGAGGGLGSVACQIAARALGLRVIGVDHGSKADFVTSSGAELFVDITKFSSDEDIIAHVKSLTDGFGVHAALVVTASNKAYAQALNFVRSNGTLVCVGLPEEDLVPIAGASPHKLIMRQISVVGSVVGNQREAIGVLDFAARGLVKGQVELRKMEDLTRTFEELSAGKIHGRVVLDLSL